MKLENLSDKALSKVASNLATEHRRRANRKAAATAILAVLKKHKLSVNDMTELDFGKRTAKTRRKKTVTSKAKENPSEKREKRHKPVYKYKNKNGSEKWSGRGRPPKWVSEILSREGISIAQFKALKRFKI